MINNYSLLLAIARQQQQEMLRQAEAERLYKQLAGSRFALLHQVVHRLLTTARQLTVYPQSNPATPTFRGR